MRLRARIAWIRRHKWFLFARRATFLQVFLTLALFRIVRKPWGDATRLSESVYADQPTSIFFAALDTRWFWIGASTLILVALFNLRYSRMANGRWVRVMIAPVVVGLAWYYSCTHYNLFFDAYFVVDRVMIAALGLLCVWRPSAVPLFLTTIILFVGQERYSPTPPSWTDKRLAIEALMLFSSWLVWREIMGAKVRALTLALLTLVAASYFRPFLGKLFLPGSWVFDNDLSNLFLAANHAGWLSGLSPELIAQIASGVSALSLVLALWTLIAEACGVASMFHRRLALIVLPIFVAFNLGVLIASGIFFWKWILVNVCLWLYIWRAPRDDIARTSIWIKVACALCVLFSQWTLHSQQLAWFDSPADQTVKFYVVGESGVRYAVSPNTFAPYSLPFAQGRFPYLYDGVPKLVGIYGAVTTSKKLARVTNLGREGFTAFAKGEGKALPKHKRDRANARVKRFDRFLMRWFTNWRAHGERPLEWLPRPPYHLNSQHENPYNGQEPLRHLTAEVVYAWKGIEVHRRVVRTIKF